VTVDHRLELDLGRATERAPHRNAELIAATVREASAKSSSLSRSLRPQKGPAQYRTIGDALSA